MRFFKITVLLFISGSVFGQVNGLSHEQISKFGIDSIMEISIYKNNPYYDTLYETFIYDTNGYLINTNYHARLKNSSGRIKIDYGYDEFGNLNYKQSWLVLWDAACFTISSDYIRERTDTLHIIHESWRKKTKEEFFYISTPVYKRIDYSNFCYFIYPDSIIKIRNDSITFNDMLNDTVYSRVLYSTLLTDENRYIAYNGKVYVMNSENEILYAVKSIYGYDFFKKHNFSFPTILRISEKEEKEDITKYSKSIYINYFFKNGIISGFYF